MEGKKAIVIGLAIVAVAGAGLYFLLRKKAPPICTEGQTQTRTCPDGTVITTAVCQGGRWVSTGKTCPGVPPEEINAEITDIRFTPGIYVPGGTIIIGVDFKNTGNVSHKFKIGVSIGKDNVAWYDRGYYNDGYGDYREATLAPGYSVVVSRSLKVPDDIRITDIWASVRDQNLNILDDKKKLNVISVKEKLLITYASADDYVAARIIYDDLAAYCNAVLKKCASYSELGNYDAVAVVGGQDAWGMCAANLFTSLGFMLINETHTGNVYIQKKNYPTIVYAVAGLLKADTERSARYFSARAKQVGLKNVEATI